MYTFVKEISDICSKYPLKEKIVIVDSYTIGEQINEAFVKEGLQAINLKYKTVHDLAQTILELNTVKPFTRLDHTVGLHFTYILLKNLKEQGKLHYFSGMEITPSFSHSIYTTIQTLRLSGYTATNLRTDAFITAEKAGDLADILKAYENVLDTHQMTDNAALLSKAIKWVEVDESRVYLLQSNLNLTGLEEQFLKGFLPESVYKLPLAPVYGVKLPERTSIASIAFGDPTPLSYLFQQEEDSSSENLSVFTAKTEELEVKQILEKIKRTNTPLDECVVYYTTDDTYVTLFYHFAQRMEIPLTFGEGLPVTFSRPGRFVSGLLEWIQSNYSTQAFLDMLNEGLLDLGEGAPSKSRISKLLRDLQVGWSQERYLTHLDAEIDRLNEKLIQADENAVYESRVKELSWLKLFFSTIFKKLPLTVGTQINYKSCLNGLVYLLKNHCNTASVIDKVSKTTLLEEIDKILPFADESLSRYEMFEKVKDLLLSIRVNQSRPKPGYLHVASYKTGIYNCRSSVFIVGLDNKKFPGNLSEDPLLLDTERLWLGNGLPLLRENGQENLYILLQVLANSTGEVGVSFCNFNMNDNRVVNPSFVILQCYRLVSGNRDAEFKDLKMLEAPIIANDIFEDKDYWIEKLTDKDPHQLQDSVLSHFRNIKEGITAQRARHAVDFSKYDGLVQIEIEQFDPRHHPTKTMTAGKFETLAKCPYSYFLKEILQIRPIEKVSFDANKWLDPASRGSLLHSIFERFYKKLKQDQVKPSYSEHLDLILAIATEVLQLQKEILPPPNDRVFQHEVTDILECCKIFLKEEERHSEDYEPLHFEYAFGIGENDPALITLPSGEVKISGIIDRVDLSADGKYHIIDYKTGSTYGYSKNGAFKGGRQLQHMIYALAIEQHLKLGEGAVEESSYYFPTQKGLAQRYTRKQDTTLRTNGLDILEKLIDVIKQGHFEMTDDVNDCKYCEFKLVCRRHFYDPDALAIKQSNQKLKGVRAYD